MNTVGKIFVGLVCFFSLVFMTIAWTVFQTHRNWRDIAIENKKKIESLQDSVTRLRAEIERSKDRLALEQASRKYALATLQTKLEQAESQYQAREAEYQKLQVSLGNLTQVVGTTSQTLDATLKANEGLRGSLRDTQQARDTVFDSIVALTDKKNELEGTREVLSERNSQLTSLYTAARDLLSRNEIDENAPVDGKPPMVEGQIVSIGNKDLLEISIGSDDGLKPGHTLEVFRNSAYLGRVVVRETAPDRAVVQIIPEFRKGSFKVGDRVATKLG